MKLTVHVVIHTDDDSDAASGSAVREVLTVQREALTTETLGLDLAEAKDLLEAVQDTVVNAQITQALDEQAPCPHCGRTRRHKDSRHIVVRSLFGVLRLPSPRWWHCSCQPQPAATFSPLATLTPQRITPELSYLQARFAGLTAYGLSASLLGELLPWGDVCTPAQCAARPRRWPSGSKTSSVMSGSASSTPASSTARNCPARTCH